MIRISRALVCVSDKRGVEELARGLSRHGVEVLSTGGTARALREAGATRHRGRRLHRRARDPRRARQDAPSEDPRRPARPRHARASRRRWRKHGIEKIDLVVVNLYPFRETVARAERDAGRGDREHRHRRAVDDPLGGEEPRARHGGRRSRRLRRAHRGARRQRGADLGGAALPLARKAFAYTAAYDGAIANLLTVARPTTPSSGAERRGEPAPLVTSRSPRC